MASKLFSPLRLRELEFKNRIFLSPMCQYSSENGMPTDWHFVHLGSRAVGGAALVMVEATAVSPEGRISPGDSGLWSDEHAQAFKRITEFVKKQGAVPGMQLAHAGRKASTDVPWRGGGPLSEDAGGWQPIAPSPLPFDDSSPKPAEMTRQDMERVISQFSAAARHSLEAGFQVVEIHMAHGYLLHEFLSPFPIKGRTNTAGAWKIESGSPCESPEPSGKNGPFRSSCGSPARIGRRADGIWTSPWFFAAGSRRSALIWLTAPAAPWCPTPGFPQDRDTRHLLRQPSARKWGSPLRLLV